MAKDSESIKQAVFLDRDGVINKDSKHYIKSLEEFKYLPKSLDAIKRLTEKGLPVIVITNQSAIGRNLMPFAELEKIHRKLINDVEAVGGEIRDIFFCPHTPDEACSCRKPKPGLILQAQRKYRIDLSFSVMVGDRAKDIETARNAGVKIAVLVKSGIETDEETVLEKKRITPDHIAANLWDAVDWILRTVVS